MVAAKLVLRDQQRAGDRDGEPAEPGRNLEQGGLRGEVGAGAPAASSGRSRTASMNPSRRRPTAWKATRSESPWIVSVTYAPSRPSASRASRAEPVDPPPRHRRREPGVEHERQERERRSARRDRQRDSTVPGTRIATSAGATVGRKILDVSMSWLASAIRSPERRRTR